MSQPLLTESSDKTRQRIARHEPHPASTRSFQGGTDPFLQLQRTLGNYRVAQLIKAGRLTPEGRIIGSRISGLQPKLTVGAADDQYEQEADRVARQVVTTPDPAATDSLQQAHQIEGEAGQTQSRTLQSKPLAASITPFVQRQMGDEEQIEEEKDQEEDKDKIQTKRSTAAINSVLQLLIENNEEPKDEATTVRAHSLIQRAALPEEENQELQTEALALPAASFMQRQAENDEDAENNDAAIQAKLTNETYGQPLQRQSAIEEEETESIQAKPPISLADSFEAGEDVESQLNRSKGSGSPLPDAVRTYMEPRFGVDFGHVRVHTDTDSIQMNQEVGAQAFTHGSDIYYGAGSSPSNLELTAHELTHVVQQRLLTPVLSMDTSRVQRHPAIRVLLRAGRWLAGRTTRAISKHIARHGRRIAGRAVHSIFRNPREIRDLTSRAVREGIELARRATRHAANEVLEEGGVRVFRQATKTPGKFRYVLEKDFFREIGTRGERVLRIIIDESGRLVTAFPVDRFMIFGLTAGAVTIFSEQVASASERVRERIEAEENRPTDWLGEIIDFLNPLSGGTLNEGEDLLLDIDRIVEQTTAEVIQEIEETERVCLGSEQREAIRDLVRVGIGNPLELEHLEED